MSIDCNDRPAVLATAAESSSLDGRYKQSTRRSRDATMGLFDLMETRSRLGSKRPRDDYSLDR